MSEYKNIKLQRAENLRLNCKYDEALEVIIDFEKDVPKESEDYLASLIIKGYIFANKANYKNSVEIGNQAFELSHRLSENKRVIDALLLKCFILFFGEFESALELCINNIKITLLSFSI